MVISGFFGSGLTEAISSQKVLNIFSPKESDGISPHKTLEIISPIETDTIEIPERILKKVRKDSPPAENKDLMDSKSFDALELPSLSKKDNLTPISEKKKLTWEEYMKDDHSKDKKPEGERKK